MRYLVAFLLISIFIFSACEDRDDNLNGPNVRIENNSGQNFRFVQVRSENDSIFYENIAPEGFSNYLEYEMAYQQDTLTIETDSTEVRFVPDSISDLLPLGLYTYKINISAEGEVELTFKVD